MASRVVGSIAGAEIWLSNRAKEDVDRAGTYRDKGWQWHPYDVTLRGIGAARLWSFAVEPAGEGQQPAKEMVFSLEEQRAEAARRYFAPELARVIRQQIYILGRAMPNFVMTTVGKPPPGDRWTSLKPARPKLYPTAPEFANLPAEDAALLNEFYNLVQEIEDTLSYWIDNEPPLPVVNAWNFLMQKVCHSLEAGKVAAQRFCPDRQFDATMPAAGTLTHRMEVAISSVKPALDAHLARHAAAGTAPATSPARRAQPSPAIRQTVPPRGPHGWMAR